MSTNFSLISDIHSQAQQLSDALDYCQKNNLTPLFLGDLFDSKCEDSDSMGVYNLVRNAQENMNAIIIQSNHQNKLIRYLRGNDVVQNFGLDKTIAELQSLDQSKLLSWLESFPYAIVFKDKNNLEYRVSHAYFSSQIDVPEYVNFYLFYELPKKHQQQMLYGIFSGKDRINWWENKSHNNWIRVCGHYHHVHIDDHSIVLDGCCGEDGGKLLMYDVNQKQLHQF